MDTIINQNRKRLSALRFGGAICITSVLLASCGDPNYQPEPDPSTVKVIKADSTIKGE